MKSGLCSRPALLGLATVALVALAPPLSAQARSSATRGLAGTQAPARSHTRATHAKYVNPFADPSWQVSRTDMGVDWVPTRRLPVLAIGDAVVLGSDSHSGWPGGHLIWYQLLNGSYGGDVVYVAEHLARLLPAGRVVRAGQQIALAIPGYPYTEWGWADAYGSPRAAPCYREGQQTNSGKEMARFLASLGAPVGDNPGRGLARPSGRLC